MRCYDASEVLLFRWGDRKSMRNHRQYETMGFPWVSHQINSTFMVFHWCSMVFPWSVVPFNQANDIWGAVSAIVCNRKSAEGRSLDEWCRNGLIPWINCVIWCVIQWWLLLIQCVYPMTTVIHVIRSWKFEAWRRLRSKCHPWRLHCRRWIGHIFGNHLM